MAKDYQKYNFIDFITDESFKSWVLEPTPESDYFWKSWMESHPEKADKIAAAREFVLSLKFRKQTPSQKKSMIYQQVINQSKASSDTRSSSGFLGINQRNLRIAASIILILGLSWTAIQWGMDEVVNTQLVNTYELKTTQKGEKLTVMLPDGTLVKLNAESSLKYPKAFTDQREVYLTGEAFFEVARDTTKPFVVATRHLFTTALGTSFNINAYSDAEEVTLLTGKVRIDDDNRSEILLPGEMVAYENGAIKKSRNVPLHHVKWKDGILVFHETPLEEGIKELERWYGVKIDIKNLSKPEVNLTGLFDNQNLENVLKSLSYTARFDFSIEGKKVLITFKETRM